MSVYRKIYTKIWNDEKFRSFSDGGKLVFFFLLTHPGMTSIGAMRGTIPGLAAELGWTTEAFREAFQEAYAKGIVEHDERASFIGLPNFLKYNKPESPNVVKAWAKSFDLIPECRLKFSLYQRVKAYVEALGEAFPKAFHEAFPKDFAKAMANQEQEQEQDKDTALRDVSESKPVKRKSRGPGPLAAISEESMRDTGKLIGHHRHIINLGHGSRWGFTQTDASRIEFIAMAISAIDKAEAGGGSAVALFNSSIQERRRFINCPQEDRARELYREWKREKQGPALALAAVAESNRFEMPETEGDEE